MTVRRRRAHLRCRVRKAARLRLWRATKVSVLGCHLIRVLLVSGWYTGILRRAISHPIFRRRRRLLSIREWLGCRRRGRVVSGSLWLWRGDGRACWGGRAAIALRRNHAFSSRGELSANGCLLELSHDWTHAVPVLCQSGRGRGGREWCVAEVESAGSHDGLEMTDEDRGILLRPEVDIQAVELVEVLLLVARVVSWETPLLLILDEGVYLQCEASGMLVAILRSDEIERAGESILLRCPGMVGYFKLGVMGGGVMVDVQVAALAEAVVWWFTAGVREVVVNIGEATSVSAKSSSGLKWVWYTE